MLTSDQRQISFARDVGCLAKPKLILRKNHKIVVCHDLWVQLVLECANMPTELDTAHTYLQLVTIDDVLQADVFQDADTLLTHRLRAFSIGHGEV